jgi:glycine/serine hydroxymethyltransferase
MGVAEMTRFGMQEADVAELAQLIRDAVVDDAPIADKVVALRGRFTELRYCFGPGEYPELVERLSRLLSV